MEQGPTPEPAPAVDPRSASYYDDSSAALGLSHSAGSGAQYYCEPCRLGFTLADWLEHCKLGHVRERNPLLSDPAWNDEENARLAPTIDAEREERAIHEREVQQLTDALGVKRVERPRVRTKDGRVVELASNAGAYAEERIELQRVRAECPDLPLVEAQRIALARVAERAKAIAAGELDPADTLTEPERERAAERDYLGDSIDNLMGSKRTVHAGGGAGNKVHFVTKDGVVIGQQETMGAKSAGAGGGGGGGASKPRNKPVCKTCHLVACVCAALVGPDGEKIDAISELPSGNHCRKCDRLRSACECYEGRSAPVSGRMSKGAKRMVQESTISAGELLEAVVGAAKRSRLTIAQMHAVLEAFTGSSESREAS